MLKIGKLGFDADPANWPEGVWGTFQEGVRFKVRKITTEILQKLRDKCCSSEMELDPNSRRMIPVKKLNEKKYDDLIADFMLEDFEGVGSDDSDQFLDKSLESKKRIMNVTALRDWIWAAAFSLDMADIQKKEDELKN